MKLLKKYKIPGYILRRKEMTKLHGYVYNSSKTECVLVEGPWIKIHELVKRFPVKIWPYFEIYEQPHMKTSPNHKLCILSTIDRRVK